MRTIIATVALVIIGIVLGGLGFIYSGVYNVGATDRHWALTYRVLEIARNRSIKAHAAGIAVPANLDDPTKIVIGVEHFADHCAVCHGAPGVPQGDIAKGMYPQPPDLTDTAKRYAPAELFWIVKNGIKMTGMPSWSQHSDDEVWGTVAFLKKLPGMSVAEYAKLVMQAMQHGGQHHPGGADKGADHRPESGPAQQHDHGPQTAPASK